MGQMLDLMVGAARRGRGFAEKALVGITPQNFARKPRFETTTGTRIIDCNHPAFVFGHLAIYPARAAALLNVDATGLAAPAEFPDLFKAGVECKDDAEGRIYPSMEIITRAFFSGHDALYDRLAKVDDSILLQPTPDEKTRATFQLIGNAAAFLLTSHVMMHMGQVSTWRRCFGLPSAM